MVIEVSCYLKTVFFVSIIIMGITVVLNDLGLHALEKKRVYWKGYQYFIQNDLDTY